MYITGEMAHRIIITLFPDVDMIAIGQLMSPFGGLLNLRDCKTILDTFFVIFLMQMSSADPSPSRAGVSLFRDFACDVRLYLHYDKLD